MNETMLQRNFSPLFTSSINVLLEQFLLSVIADVKGNNY